MVDLHSLITSGLLMGGGSGLGRETSRQQELLEVILLTAGVGGLGSTGAGSLPTKEEGVLRLFQTVLLVKREKRTILL